MRTEQAPRLPNDIGRPVNDFGVLFIDSDTAHKSTPLPAEWQGRRILLMCITNAVHVAGSLNAGDEVDRAAAPTDAGTALKAGFPMTPGVLYDFELPSWHGGQTFSLVHEAAVDNTNLVAMLAD